MLSKHVDIIPFSISVLSQADCRAEKSKVKMTEQSTKHYARTDVSVQFIFSKRRRRCSALRAVCAKLCSASISRNLFLSSLLPLSHTMRDTKRRFDFVQKSARDGLGAAGAAVAAHCFDLPSFHHNRNDDDAGNILRTALLPTRQGTKRSEGQDENCKKSGAEWCICALIEVLCGQCTTNRCGNRSAIYSLTPTTSLSSIFL